MNAISNIFLEDFFKVSYGLWVSIAPCKNTIIFLNFGDAYSDASQLNIFLNQYLSQCEKNHGDASSCTLQKCIFEHYLFKITTESFLSSLLQE